MKFSTPELLARRLISQGLARSQARPAFDTPAAAAAGLLAVQGQNYAGGIRALALRSGSSDEEVLAAVERLEIVRSWPQRGTLHFLAAEDATWLARLLHPRIMNAQAQRQPALGLSPEAVSRAHSSLADALRSETLTRKQCYQVFSAARVDPGAGRGPHLLRYLGTLGVIIQGPRKGKEETFMAVEALGVGKHEEATLEELGSRYVRGHGPVSVADLTWWAGITKAQATQALAGLPTASCAGETYYLADWQADVTAKEIRDALDLRLELPAFDEYLLGYANKSTIVPDELRVDVLSSNGLSWPWIMQGGVGVASLRKK